jgi:hypothetical protein
VSFRIATLNLARNDKRWEERRELIAQQLAHLKPDIVSLNEIWLPSQSGPYGLYIIARSRWQADSSGLEAV